MRTNTAIAFEQALRDLQTDGFRHHRQMALAVAPFLQALMLGVSNDLRCFAERCGRRLKTRPVAPIEN
jgi:hypothetical protein